LFIDRRYQELKGAKLQYERAAKIAEIYKKKSDKQNDLYEKQDKMLGTLLILVAKKIFCDLL
jgi:hypothetical protein